MEKRSGRPVKGAIPYPNVYLLSIRGRIRVDLEKARNTYLDISCHVEVTDFNHPFPGDHAVASSQVSMIICQFELDDSEDFFPGEVGKDYICKVPVYDSFT